MTVAAYFSSWISRKPVGVGREQSLFEKPVELHQLHQLVRLVAARPVVVQHAEDSARAHRGEALGRRELGVGELLHREQRDQVRLHLLDSIGPALERLVEAAAVAGCFRAEVVADLVPEGALEAAVARQTAAGRGCDGGVPAPLGVGEEIGVLHDVLAHQDGPAVAAREQRVVGQVRRRVRAARLSEVGDHLVDPDRNLLPHPFVRRIGEARLRSSADCRATWRARRWPPRRAAAGSSKETP